MKRTILLLVLLCGLPLTDRVEAKGRSYSSGRSSFGRSSSSHSGGGSTFHASGRSYSSGSPSVGKGVPVTGSSKPSPSVSRPGTSGTKPATPSFDRGAAAAQRRQESKSAYDARGGGAGANPVGASSEGRSYSAGPSVPASNPTGRSYSLERARRGDSYDATAAAAQRREESKAAYTQGRPRTNYTTRQGESRPLNPEDRAVERLRRQPDLSQWSTRQQRREKIIVPSPPPAPVVVYHDPFSNWFWFWLLAQNQQTRAAWAYNHHREMDEARYRDLLAKDKQLENRIHELEVKGVAPDPNYVPPDMDYDLMFDDGFVDAAVNPQPVPRTEAPPASSGQVRPAPSSARSVAGALWRILLIVAVMAFLVWLVFIKRWGGT